MSRVAFQATGGSSPADHAAIFEVLQNRAAMRGVSLVRTMRAYSPKATCTRYPCTGRSATTNGRTMWIQRLGLSGHRPAEYLGLFPWPRIRARWLATVEYTRDLFAGRAQSQCVAPPLNWGCERPDRGCNDTPGYLAEWRDRRGMSPCGVDCGDTGNVFWRPNGGC